MAGAILDEPGCPGGEQLSPRAGWASSLSRRTSRMLSRSAAPIGSTPINALCFLATNLAAIGDAF